MQKKIKIRSKKERALLSDVLPYETPVTFSNRHFYDFLEDSQFELGLVKQKASLICKVKTTIFSFLMGFDTSQKRGDFSTIPFTYKISHKEKEFRELSICHPGNQLKVVDFYEKYKSLILYYCSLSPYSIRKPVRAAQYTYINDGKHNQKLASGTSLIEEFDREYKNQKSFFVYKDYSNVHKFYESYKFHRCEKKYNYLLKLDISKCFDSIYTHSVAWALINKESVKASLHKLRNTFADDFDSLMQELNYQETNGIIIGPEFSRIFAELILQSVDVAVEKKLRDENKLLHKTNYEIFRYVDDYFIFYNEEQDKKSIVETLQHELKIYKLYLNSSKEEDFSKPIITNITIAKESVKKLLKDKLEYSIEIEAPEYTCTNPHLGCAGKSKGCVGKPKSKIYIRSNNLITEFKTIIKQSGVEYQDILNYTLALIESGSHDILSNYDGKNGFIEQYNKYHECAKLHLEPGVTSQELDIDFEKFKVSKEEQLIKAIVELLEFTFFICSVSPKVNTTIKLSRIAMVFIQFLNNRKNNKDLKHYVFKTISDNLILILNKNKLNKYTQVETLYLLLILRELGRNYRLNPETLMKYLGMQSDGGTLSSTVEFNYFSITVALTYIKDIKIYEPIKAFIESEIIKKFKEKESSVRKHAELVLLLLDSLACPYISQITKTALLDIYKIEAKLHNDIIQFRKTWFTDWIGFNFNKELEAKRSREVY